MSCSKGPDNPYNLEALRMISGFAAVVAICVTQPECPLRVPLNFSCSVILLQREDGNGF